MPALRSAHGTPESELTDAAAARIPASSPAAPWSVTAQGAVWLHRATRTGRDRAAADAAPRGVLPVTVGAVLRYDETPIGPYGEVLGAPAFSAELPLPAALIAFIAVDSAASVHGGRANWALPKVFARFTWSGEPGAGAFAVRAEGEDAAVPWAVRVVVRPRRRGLAVRLPVRARRPPPGGLIPVGARAELRPAVVDVDVEGAGL